MPENNELGGFGTLVDNPHPLTDTTWLDAVGGMAEGTPHTGAILVDRVPPNNLWEDTLDRIVPLGELDLGTPVPPITNVYRTTRSNHNAIGPGGSSDPWTRLEEKMDKILDILQKKNQPSDTEFKF